jgi:putative ABC transport system permease protein
MRVLPTGLASDLRFGVRGLRKTPAFTVGAIVTIALAVGATTAVFSVVYGVLLRQLPYRNAQDVYWIWSDQPGRDRAPFNVPDFIDYRDSQQALAGLAGFFAYSANLSDDEASAERVQGLRATGNVFDVLGVAARLGRVLQPSDEQPGAGAVVVLTEPFWRQRYGADPAIVGRAVRLNGEAHTVVGILAPGFAAVVRDVEFVIPFAPDRDPRRGLRNSLNFIIGVGRLGEGASLARATDDLNTIARQLLARFPVENARKRGVRLVGVLDGVVASHRTSLWTGFAAVAAVLLIAAANLANLMLSRLTSRRKELAVQLALGASRLAVARQTLVEALLVSVAGGALGVVVASWGVSMLLSLMPSELPRTGEVRLDRAVLVFSLAVAALTGLLLGVAPAAAAAKGDVRDALQGSGRATTAGSRGMHGALVTVEVALAVALLVVMTSLAKSFASVQAVRPGFDPAGALTARLTLPAARFHTADAIVTFQRALAAEIERLPSVTHVGAVSLLPLSGLVSRVPFSVEGRAIEREQVPAAQYRVVTPGYFEAARIPILRGRGVSAADAEQSPAVALVSESLARRWLDGLDPIGARLLVDDNDVGPRPIEIVGVVGDVRQMTLDGEPTWDLYLAYAQIPHDNVGLAAGNMFWVVRTEGDPTQLAGGLAGAVRRVDPGVAASQVWPMTRYLSEAMATRRFSVGLMTAFSLAALALALTGIHAVVSYTVSQRTREIGVRLALGATRATIVGLVVGQCTRFIALGVAVGIIIAATASRLIATTLVGVAAIDLVTFTEVAALVAVVAIAACLAPARRAAGIRASVLGAE